MSDSTIPIDDEAPPVRPEQQSILRADGIVVRASWGHIFGPLDLTVRTGGVTILSAPGGRARTALLMVLCGRMRPSQGTLTSFGAIRNPHALFTKSAVALIPEVDYIEQAITVQDVVTDQLRWNAPWYKFVPRASADDIERVCRPVFGVHPVPNPKAFVEELPELDNALLRIALANLRRPPLLVVGGIDGMTRDHNRQLLLEQLIELGREQTVVTADVNAYEPEPGVREVIAVNELIESEFDALGDADDDPLSDELARIQQEDVR
ncbi:hypothetical protein M1M07_02610 [Rhodococcus sp. HM1]|uniref:hypothetical protein n=1 Tax=Rhodococcus sp. HM1 TaxID=2937759 RepID=UPI00200AAAEA|nr:hypothetical protein [Rhodococcus sp. HM1]MCK8670009.1 hypothetical protein [Rhodococcus sp. HM1]